TFSGAAGWWVMIAAFALFIKNNIAYNQARNVELDMLDAQIMAEYTVPARRGTPKSQTAGYSAGSLPFALDRNPAGVPDTLQAASVPDFSATLRDTIGQTQTATAPPSTGTTPPPTAPPGSGWEDPRPFEFAVPHGRGGTATTAPPRERKATV